MKRLRDMEASSPLEKKAQQLLSSVEPVSSSPERMARVRRQLDAPRGWMVGLRRMPALALAALVGLFGASAFAAVRVFEELWSEPPVETREAPATQSASDTRAAPPPKPAPAMVDPQPAEPEAVDDPGPPSHKPAPSRPRAKARSATPAEEAAHDSELVHRAVQALRRDHDPKLAARLLDEDRVRNPRGPLAEEALSLRIEAAIELGEPRARTLAQQYLARYPRGRYVAIARRALEGPSR